jgi:small subunit ribosomal protein S18
MARGGGDRDRERKRAPKDTGKRIKKKVCVFCKDQVKWVDYKDVNLLRRFMSDRGKIRARRVSGNCRRHQSDAAIAIKTARELALLPYSQRATSEGGRGGGRGGRGGRDGGGGGPRFGGPSRGPGPGSGPPPDPTEPPPTGFESAGVSLDGDAVGALSDVGPGADDGELS